MLDLEALTWAGQQYFCFFLGLDTNWRAQSKNDPLIFRPFLKVSTCQNSTTSEHFKKWLKNQGIVLALSPPIAFLSLGFRAWLFEV